MMKATLAVLAILAAPVAAFAQTAVPTLRASVTVTGDIVRIGDVIDNAGNAAQVAIFRAPDLGTTGSLPVRQLLTALRAHQVIAVDTRDLTEVSVTRAARLIEGSDIEKQIALALEHRAGLGNAADLSLTFDRAPATLRLDSASTGALTLTSARFEPLRGRFDVAFEIANDNGAPTRLRYTGTAVETVDAAVLVRGIERNEIIKASDIVIERRPKVEIGIDTTLRDRSVGMQARRSLRAGQALRAADLAKPDLVQRDQSVMLIYQTAGLYLTVRGKAVENGTEGDVVSVLNLQSKRTVSGVVTARGQVTVEAPTPRPTAVADVQPAAQPVAVAAATVKPE